MAGKQQVTVSFIADVAGMRKGIDQVNNSLTTFEKTTQKIGGLMAGAFAVDKLIQAGKAAIDAASNFQQAAGATEALFGKSAAAAIDKWASQAAGALGLSATQALEAANRFAIAGKQMGLTGKELTDYTQGMTANAADMAAMFGGTVPEAIDAMAAALRGEMDPIERYGIAINAAAIDAEAAAQGFKKAGSSWDAQAKSSAVSAIIKNQMQLNGAVGAFAREGDTYAGQVARLSAEWDNFVTAVGTAVLPIITGLVEGLRGILTVAQNMGPYLKSLAVAAGAVAIAFGLMNAQTIIFNAQVAFMLVRIAAARVALLALAAATGPIGLLVAAITALTFALPEMAKEAERTREIMKDLIPDEEARGRVRSNTAIIGAAMRAQGEAGRKAASTIEGSWTDANGLIAGSTYTVTRKIVKDYQWTAEQITNAATWWSDQAWKAGQNAANSIILARSQLSGTVSAAITEAGFNAAMRLESTPPWEKVGEAVGRKVGGGTSKGLKAETKIMLADWLADWSNIDVEVETKLSKAGGKLAESYKTRLDALKAAAQAYEKTVAESIDAVNKKVEDYSKGLSEAFLGFKLSDFVKEIKDDQGNVTSTIFDSDAFQKWLGDKESIRTGLSPLLNQIPQVWAEQIMGMDNASAKATIDWLTTSPDQAANLQSTFTQLSADVKATLSDPLAEAMRGSYWEAQMEGIRAAKEAVETEAESFRKFVKKQLRTKIVIDIEYREVAPPPAMAAAGRSTVAQIQSFEALNGRSWRL